LKDVNYKIVIPNYALSMSGVCFAKLLNVIFLLSPFEKIDHSLFYVGNYIGWAKSRYTKIGCYTIYFIPTFDPLCIKYIKTNWVKFRPWNLLIKSVKDRV